MPVGRPMSDFQERLQKLREKRGISRVVLSQLCGFGDGRIRRYERGEQQPTLHALIVLADEFGVSLDYLAGRDDYASR